MIAIVLSCLIPLQDVDPFWDVTKALLEKASAAKAPLKTGSLLVTTSNGEIWIALSGLDEKTHGYASINPQRVYFYGLFDETTKRLRMPKGDAQFSKDPQSPGDAQILARVLSEKEMRPALRKGFDFEVMPDSKAFYVFIGKLDRTVDSTFVVKVSLDLKRVTFIYPGG